MSERRPFKKPWRVGGPGVTRPESVLRNPQGVERLPTRRDFKQLEYFNSEPQSEFITTRCYSPAGTQIWDGDHGADVRALAIGPGRIIYQSGSSGAFDLGDSLFHEVAEGQYPLVTAMYWGGEPKWSVKVPGLYHSHGIAATTDGFVYAGYRVAINDSRNRLVKLTQSTGLELSELPTDGFDYSQFNDTTMWERVRVDADNNVYAYGGGFIAKWVSDVEFWNLPSIVTGGYTYQGFDVSDDGRVFTSSHPISSAPPGASVLFSITDSTVTNLPGAGGGYLARIFRPNPGPLDPPEAGYTFWEHLGWHGCGVSPSGRSIVQGPTLDDYTNVGIIEITANGLDPDDPATAFKVAVPNLGGSFGSGGRLTGIAINDSGIYSYSVPRTTVTHHIRAADNSLIGSYDHGGEINDIIVLPNGYTIVAGERVARAALP